MTQQRAFVLVLLAALACACGKKKESEIDRLKRERGDNARNVGAPVSYDLKDHGVIPPFKLLGCHGAPVANDTLLGKVWVSAFVFTNCPTHCVQMAKEMQRLQKDLQDAPDFLIVAATVDPARDTPQKFLAWGRLYEAAKDRWLFLWGKREQVRQFCVDGMKIGWSKEEPLIHSTTFTLIDKKGHRRGWYVLTEEGRMEKLRADIRVLLAE